MEQTQHVDAQQNAITRLAAFLTQRNGFNLSGDAFPLLNTAGALTLSGAIMVATVLAYVGVFIIRDGMNSVNVADSSLAVQSQLLTYATSVPYLLWVTPRLAKRSLQYLGFRLSLPSSAIAGIAGGLVMMLCFSDGLGAVLDHFYGQHEQNVTHILHQLHTPAMSFAFIFMAIIAAPLSEEVFFRGLVFNALYKSMPLWLAATISGCLFSLAHGDWYAFFPLWIGGIVLSLFYARHRNMWVNIITHSLFNVFGTLSAFATK